MRTKVLQYIYQQLNSPFKAGCAVCSFQLPSQTNESLSCATMVGKTSVRVGPLALRPLCVDRYLIQNNISFSFYYWWPCLYWKVPGSIPGPPRCRSVGRGRGEGGSLLLHHQQEYIKKTKYEKIDKKIGTVTFFIPVVGKSRPSIKTP